MAESTPDPVAVRTPRSTADPASGATDHPASGSRAGSASGPPPGSEPPGVLADLRADAHLYRLLVGARIRAGWQYRISFLTFLLGQALVTTLDFVTILLLLELIPGLGGWEPAQVVFLYGLASIPFALSDLVVSPVEQVSVYVKEGTFDRLLLRPVPALLQLSALEFELRRVGKLIPGVAIMAWAVPNVGVDWTVASVALLGLAAICGTMIYSALWIMVSALSFWVVDMRAATNAATYGGQYASQYPLHLYRPWIRAVLGWALPLAFVAYVPTITLLDAANPLDLPRWLIHLSAPVAAATLAVAMVCWSVGIRHYQSTGS